MIDVSYLGQIDVFQSNYTGSREERSNAPKEDEDSNVNIVYEEGGRTPKTWEENAVS